MKVLSDSFLKILIPFSCYQGDFFCAWTNVLLSARLRSDKPFLKYFLFECSCRAEEQSYAGHGNRIYESDFGFKFMSLRILCCFPSFFNLQILHPPSLALYWVDYSTMWSRARWWKCLSLFQNISHRGKLRSVSETMEDSPSCNKSENRFVPKVKLDFVHSSIEDAEDSHLFQKNEYFFGLDPFFISFCSVIMFKKFVSFCTASLVAPVYSNAPGKPPQLAGTTPAIFYSRWPFDMNPMLGVSNRTRVSETFSNKVLLWFHLWKSTYIPMPCNSMVLVPSIAFGTDSAEKLVKRSLW